MALFTVHCQGKTWQEDLEPLVPNLDNLFGAYFKRDSDKDDKIAEALAFFMIKFSRAWKPGETITLSTNFTVRDIRKGRKFCPSNPTGSKKPIKSVLAFSNKSDLIGRIKRQIARLDAWADYRILRDSLPEHEGIALRMAVEEGYTMNEVARAIKKDWCKVRDILRDTLEILAN